MAQVFHPSTNTLSKVTLFGGVFILGAVAWGVNEIQRAPWITEAQVAREQPVPFSHKHHVQGLGIDCRFCHTGVEESSFAGIPSTKTCMGCHSQVWADAPVLEPVRESYRTDRSIEWTRVHDLPDFVYFDHSIHAKKGVGCESCHGRVDEMPLTWREHTLNMEWCLACHRDPAAFLRPKERVFEMGWVPETSERPISQRELGEALLALNRVQALTNCTTCHR
ncbi:MAG TPA: cytochrome c3 family protein [Candidatus Eisenbacteria bacterium]|nr:cytochrome c3 family protein [Candidatus Eisenbacteria bacterium]